MTGFLRHIFFRVLDRLPLFRRRGEGRGIPKERWEAGFSKPGQTHFDIKSENTYDAYLRGGGLGLGLKKTKCLAWVEGTRPYRDMILKARLQLDCGGGYGAAGIIFRMIDRGTYYLALLSSKGYFRLDAVRNNMPLALIGWTEFGEGPAASPGPWEKELTIIASGPRIILLIDGLWAGEINDSSIDAGFLGFALASYEAGRSAYAAEAFLNYLSVDTRAAELEAAELAWEEGPAGTERSAGSGGAGTVPARSIPGESRLRLAETFAAMGENAAALGQLEKIQTPEFPEEGRRLLLAARLAQTLERYGEAEEYIEACLAWNPGGEDGGGGRRGEDGPGPGSQSPESQDLRREAAVEKAKILYGQKRYNELREYIAGVPAAGTADAALPALLGHAQWELGDYEEAAAAYDRAFELDGENGLHGANVANVYQALGRNAEALDRFLAAGRAFLRAGNYRDLGVLIPKLLVLGPEHGEARALAGKWAFGIEDWEEAEREFRRAASLERKAEAGTGDPAEKDPALEYLRALLLIRKGKRREALPLLEKAVRLAPDYGLFRFRLAETRFLLDNDPADPRLRADLERALSLLDPAPVRENAEEAEAPGGTGETDGTKDPGSADTLIPAGGRGETGDPSEVGESWGWVNNLAAQVSLAAGDLGAAEKFLEQAAAVLGETPPVLVNRAVYHYLRGSLDRALALLDGAPDAGGTLANCGGNLLVRSKQFARADAYYQRALAADSGNAEFLLNRASCLIEMDRYGEADALLARAHERAPSPAALELIAYVAVKKGEYPRAEAACMAALELDKAHTPSLHSLGWIYGSAGRWEEAEEILTRLEGLALSGEDAERREELRRRILEGTTRLIPCARCGRTWRVPLDPPPVPFLRLVAMPPDELPAGTCPACGDSYCIGCAKEHLDAQGRFTCPVCGRPLKLINEGLKKIAADWAAEALPGGKDAPGE